MPCSLASCLRLFRSASNSGLPIGLGTSPPLRERRPRRARRGDAAAFEALYHDHARAVHALAFRLTGNAISATVNPGLASSETVALTGRSTNTVYTFTFANAHPLGANHMVIATPNTALSTTAFYVCTTKVESSTSFSVWCRSTANAILDGDFFVHTVP